MNDILALPELVAIHAQSGLLRIPNQLDVPVTPRVLSLVDTPEFQRLGRISQLGVVSFVYPGATHNRFEHSLGVYRMALLFLQRMAHQKRFAESVSARDASLLILAALLHDIGHWPFCHAIEDLRLPQVPRHEHLAAEYLRGESIASVLRDQWQVEPEEVIELIAGRATSVAGKILGSILSGPIDIDKMDYLYRDSLHAGVPYGQNFDAARLIRSLCLNEAGNGLAITQKGRTAAELMVFARYVMFSEVYWHHAVRSATAMFQRAFYLRYQGSQESIDAPSQEGRLDSSLFRSSEMKMLQQMRNGCHDDGCRMLLDALFGEQRQLYKRVANFSIIEGESIYRELAQRPYPWLVKCSQRLAGLIADRMGVPVGENEILIDAPPVGLEVQFEVDVFYEDENVYRKLGDVSPVVHTLAVRQFDDYVKQVRIFVAPRLRERVKELDMADCVNAAIAECR